MYRRSFIQAWLAAATTALVLKPREAEASTTHSDAEAAHGLRPEERLRPPEKGPIRVAFLLSGDAEVVDFAGPWGVFEYADKPDTPEDLFRLFTVAEHAAPLRLSGGLTVVPDHTFGDAPTPQLIIIPAQSDPTPAAVAWLKRVARTADLTASICTGAFFLAQAGLLDGKSVTTHHSSLALLAADYPGISVRRGARFVDDGGISSAGGLTSGIDLAMHIVDRYFGRETAERTALLLEYQGQAWKDPSSNTAYLQRPPLTGSPPRCPVCEGEITSRSLPTAPKESYRGKTYYFCSDAHRVRFDKSPEKFAEAS